MKRFLSEPEELKNFEFMFKNPVGGGQCRRHLPPRSWCCL